MKKEKSFSELFPSLLCYPIHNSLVKRVGKEAIPRATWMIGFESFQRLGISKSEYKFEDHITITTKDLVDYCLDKQRVKEAIDKIKDEKNWARKVFDGNDIYISVGALLDELGLE